MYGSKFYPKPAMSGTRTPGTIIKALYTKPKSTQTMSPYECCRLMGAVPKESPSIPDGSSGMHNAVCLYATDRLTFASGQTCLMQFNPWLPMFGLVQSSGTFSLNGVPFAGASSIGQSYAPMGVPAVYRYAGDGITAPIQSTSVPGYTPSVCDQYSATSFRIVSQTHKIYYTGPVTTCAGSIRAWENNMAISDEIVVTNTVSGVGINFTVKKADGTTLTVSPPGTRVLIMDGITTTTPPVSCVTVRPEQGMLISLKHSSKDYKQRPISTVPLGLTFGPFSPATNMNGVGNILALSSATGFGNCGGGIVAYDNDWVGMTVILDNMNSDASYIVETCVCVEFTPSSNSAFKALSKEGPKPDNALIAKIEKYLANRGSAHPL